ncbi:MAG: hypothetical protein WC538_04870 [Thermoanaerobaculia bacterium]|jgi:hypothetical protein
MQRCRSTVRSLVALIIVTAATAIPAEAATVRRLELDELRARAESVFSGQVLGTSTRLDSDGRMVWTDYSIEVAETLAGRDPGTVTTLTFAGGTIEGHSIGVPGVPELRVGDHYVFFIEPRPDASRPALMPTVGWGQGLYRIVRMNEGKTSTTALVSADGEPLEIAADGSLARGSSVTVSGDTIVEPGPATRDGVRVQKTSIETPDGVVRPITATPEAAQPATPPARTFATFDDLRLFAQGRLGAASVRNR